jgi:hypothetical protein
MYRALIISNSLFVQLMHINYIIKIIKIFKIIIVAPTSSGAYNPCLATITLNYELLKYLKL